MAYDPSGGLGTVSTKVELYISATGLKDSDLLSKSDPFAELQVFMRGSWTSMGKTEVVMDNLSPEWTTQFRLSYFFEEEQRMRVIVYDFDASGGHDYLGEAEVPLGRIMGSRGQVKTVELGDKRRVGGVRGRVTLRGEEVKGGNDELSFVITGHHLDKKDFFGKSDPVVHISRIRGSSKLKVWESEVIKNTLDPVFRKAQVPLQVLCNCDQDRDLVVEVYDWNRSGDLDLIGGFVTTVRSIVDGTVSRTRYPLTHPKKAKKKRYTNSGELQFQNAQIIHRPSLLEYIRGGCQISLSVAIDYTASNGAPSLPSSLHHLSPINMNEYQKAISSVGRVLQEYDSDKEFPVWGFGGQVGGRTEHCFPLTMDPTHPEVEGVEGILEVYRNSFEMVRLSGPTCFAPIITKAAEEASQYVSQEHQQYFVLLIITDGVINDIDATIDAIVAASALPLSIIIIGVGRADFGAMDILDGDDVKLRDRRGKTAVRDIVQFVPFRDFARNPEMLAKETLREVPAQFLSFMQSRRIVPNAPIEAVRTTETMRSVFKRGIGAVSAMARMSAPPTYEDGKEEPAAAAPSAAVAKPAAPGFAAAGASAFAAAAFSAPRRAPAFGGGGGGGAAAPPDAPPAYDA